MTKSRMKEGKIPSRRDVGSRKILKILGTFHEQKNFARAMELLGPDWKAVAANLKPEEIIARFLSMLAPDVFDEQREKQKPLHQAHVPRPPEHPRHGEKKTEKKPFWKKSHHAPRPHHSQRQSHHS
jgi:hypothetical protein